MEDVLHSTMGTGRRLRVEAAVESSEGLVAVLTELALHLPQPRRAGGRRARPTRANGPRRNPTTDSQLLP